MIWCNSCTVINMLTVMPRENGIEIVDQIGQFRNVLFYHIDLGKEIYARVYNKEGKSHASVFTTLPFGSRSTKQKQFIDAINSVEGTTYSLETLLDVFENYNFLDSTDCVLSYFQVKDLLAKQFSEKIKRLTDIGDDLDLSISSFLNREYSTLNSLNEKDLDSLTSFSKNLLKKSLIYLELPGFVQKYLESSSKEISSLTSNFEYQLHSANNNKESFREELKRSLSQLCDNSIQHDGDFYINPMPKVSDSTYQMILRKAYAKGNLSIVGCGALITAGLSSFLGLSGGLLLSILTLYVTEGIHYVVTDKFPNYSSERYNVKNLRKGLFQSIFFDKEYEKLFESYAREANLPIKLLAKKVNKKPFHQATSDFFKDVLSETSNIEHYSGICFKRSFPGRKDSYSWINAYSAALEKIRAD